MSAAPRRSTALTCCSGAYNSPFRLRSWPPSLTCPLTLKPNPVSDLTTLTTCGRGLKMGGEEEEEAVSEREAEELDGWEWVHGV